MIKGITGTLGVTVFGGNNVSQCINQNTNNPMQGMIRLNGSDFQVFDGSNWLMLTTQYPSVGLDEDTQDLLQWARETKNREFSRESRVRSNPALQKAYEAVQRAEANFDILDKIIGDTVVQNAVN